MKKKFGRIEQKYSLLKISKHLKIDRKELYNLSRSNFYLSECKILSVIFSFEDKKELEKKFLNFQNREKIKIENISDEYKEEIKFLEKTKIKTEELIRFLYLKQRKEEFIKRAEEDFNETLKNEIFTAEDFN